MKMSKRVKFLLSSLVIGLAIVATVANSEILLVTAIGSALGAALVAGALTTAVGGAIAVPVAYRTLPVLTSLVFNFIQVDHSFLMDGISKIDFNSSKNVTYVRCMVDDKVFWGLKEQNKWSNIEGRWGQTHFETSKGEVKGEVFLTTLTYSDLAKKCAAGYEYWYGKKMPKGAYVLPFAANHYYQRYPLMYLKEGANHNKYVIDEKISDVSLKSFINESLDLLAKNPKLTPMVEELRSSIEEGMADGESNLEMVRKIYDLLNDIQSMDLLKK